MHNTASVRTEESERANLKPGVRAAHLSGSQSALGAGCPVGRAVALVSVPTEQAKPLSLSRISACRRKSIGCCVSCPHQRVCARWWKMDCRLQNNKPRFRPACFFSPFSLVYNMGGREARAPCFSRFYWIFARESERNDIWECGVELCQPTKTRLESVREEFQSYSQVNLPKISSQKWYCAHAGISSFEIQLWLSLSGAASSNCINSNIVYVWK